MKKGKGKGREGGQPGAAVARSRMTVCCQWLQRWSWWRVAEQDERRRRKSAGGEEPAIAVAILPLVWIWVRREATPPSVGGGERCLWGLQGLKTQWRERKKERLAEERKTFTVAYYRRSGGWPVVLAKLAGAGCSRQSWRKKW
jgi:hypothetical protein